MPSASDLQGDLRHRYLDLLKRALTHTCYWPSDIDWTERPVDDAIREAVAQALADGDLDMVKSRREGIDWPKFGQTMVGLYRLDNVEHCVQQVIEDDVSGDLIEAGVWRGGVTIFMRGLLAAFDDTARDVWVADSFAGLPPPTLAEDEGDQHHTMKSLAVSRADVVRNFDLYGLLDDRVHFLEGWFADTLPTVRDRSWSVVRVDGDLYESTIDALTNLYPGLSPGGYLIVDDWAFPPCRKAVEDYRAEHGIDEPIETIDWTGVYWRRAR